VIRLEEEKGKMTRYMRHDERVDSGERKLKTRVLHRPSIWLLSLRGGFHKPNNKGKARSCEDVAEALLWHHKRPVSSTSVTQTAPVSERRVLVMEGAEEEKGLLLPGRCSAKAGGKKVAIK